MMIISSLQGIKADTLTFHRLHRFIRLILVAPLKKSATIQGEKCHYSIQIIMSIKIFAIILVRFLKLIHTFAVKSLRERASPSLQL